MNENEVLTLNNGQQAVYNLIEEGHNVCVLNSCGGTGKSYLLRKLQQDFGHETVFVSTTGVSAINIGGSTFHSALSIPLGYPTPKDLRKVSNKTQDLFASGVVKRICIDEGSMLSPSGWFTFMKRLERFNKRTKKRDERNIQVIIFGDVFQLGDVQKKDSQDYALAKEHFRTDRFYFMREFEEMRFKFVDLTKNERQSNVEMRKMLGYIRTGGYDLEADVMTTEGEAKARVKEAVDWFNSKCYRFPLPKGVTTIATTNATVDTYNKRIFMQNKNKAGVYRASITGSIKENEYPCEAVLRLKPDLRVMTLRNDKEGRWVNGSVGTVVDMTSEGVYVDFDHRDEIELVEPIVAEKYEYVTGKNEDTGEEELQREVVGTFKQVFLRQCSSISVHKSQGATLDNAILDLGKSAGWATGLTYVGLSRLTDTKGLYFKRKLRVDDISVDIEAVRWVMNNRK